MSTEYTPRLSHVRAAYVRTTRGDVGLQEARAEFTRWLDGIRAEAKAEALREAASAYPVMLRDMVSRGSVEAWLRARANQHKEEPTDGR